MDVRMILMLLIILAFCLGSLYVRTKYGDLKAKNNDDTQSSVKTARGLSKCSNCGASISNDIRFCPYCGMEKHAPRSVEIHHAEKVVIESRPSLLQHIVTERERTKQERLEKEERENRRYMIVMLIGLFGLGAFVIIMKLLYWN